MKFLFLTQYFPPEIGAAQSRLQAIVRELTKLGHQVEVVTAFPNYPTGKVFPEYKGRFYLKEIHNGITIHRVWLYAAIGAGFKRILNYMTFTINCFYGLFKCKKPDYIFVESPPMFLSIPGYIMSRIWKRPFIFNVADLWPDSAKELNLLSDGLILRILSWLEKWTYKKAMYVNAVTEGIRRTLIEKKKLSSAKILYLPNGVDTELFKIRPKNLTLAKKYDLIDKKIVLYAGTHGYAHGIEVALEAALVLQKREDIAFVFIGDGSEKNKLKIRAHEMGLTNVLFLEPSPLSIVAEWYSIASVGLSTLRDSPLFEGTRPVKIFSAMASGVPVLYSGRGEGARLVEKYNAGIVVPPEDVQALASAVLELVGNYELNRKMGENGRKYVENELSWNYLVDNWLKELIEKNKI